MAHDIFISYSTGDKPSADAVCATLESRGIRCWIAPRDVLPGEEYAAAIVSALHESRVMVLVFSSGANQSPQVLREVERGVSKGLPIIPLRIENVPPSAAMEYYISSRHWLDALTPPLEQHLVHLADTVKLLLSRMPVSPAPPAPMQAVRPVPAISAEFPIDEARRLEEGEASRLKAEQERIAREKAEAERQAAERVAAERLAREKAEQERLAREQAEAERQATERAAAEKLAQERAREERLVREKVERRRSEDLSYPVPEPWYKSKKKALLLASLLMVGLIVIVWVSLLVIYPIPPPPSPELIGLLSSPPHRPHRPHPLHPFGPPQFQRRILSIKAFRSVSWLATT